MTRGLQLVALTGALAGCTDHVAATQILVSVQSDIKPGELGRAGIVVERADGTPLVSRCVCVGAGAGCIAWPLTLNLLRDGTSTAPFRVRAQGFVTDCAAKPAVEQTAMVSFVEGASLELDLFLYRLCEGVPCTPGKTCAASVCGDENHPMLPMVGAERPAADLATPPDLSVPADLATTPDLAMPDLAMPDLAMPRGGLSCVGLAPTCGPPGPGNDSCCNSSVVPGGTYLRGYDVAMDKAFPDNTHPATVSDFRFDKYEITVGRFRKFVTAVKGGWVPQNGVGAHPLLQNSGWNYDNAGWPFDGAKLPMDINCDVGGLQTWTDNVAGNESRPMNCISWYESFAFCAWDGGFLPTDAEWGYAATGGGEQRPYPWSQPPLPKGFGDTTIDCTYADYNIGLNGNFCYPNTGTIAVGRLSPKGDGKWGQSDLSGNLMEWALDWQGAFDNVPCNDCAALQPAAKNRTVRGGSFYGLAENARVAGRGGSIPTVRNFTTGARCARAK